MNFDNNAISSILITHQARIKCYLNNFINSKIHRFMNGCILKITRHTDSRQAMTSKNDQEQWIESIELIYNGMIDEAKPDYIFYQINGPEEPTDSNEGNYKIIDFPELSRNLPLSETANYDSNSVYEFYVIRHGQAEHNIKENWGFSKQLSSRNRDTNLTSSPDNKMDGEKQAIETGKNLYDYLVKEKEQQVQTKLQTMIDENNNTPLDNQNNSQQNTLQTGIFRNQQTVQQGRVERELHGLKQKEDGSYEQKEVILNIENIFVSDLKRTRQTLQNILIGMFKSNKILKLGKSQNNDKINVSILPCSHELAHPKCDNSNMPGAVENTMNCSISNINADTACKKLKVDYLTIIFDWSKYIEFYGQGTRTKPGSKQQCKETNMISLAIDEFITNKNVGGKKKRKTRKLKKKSRKTKKKSRKSRKSKKKRKTTRRK